MERIALNLVTDLVPALVPELRLQNQSQKPIDYGPFPIRATAVRNAIMEMLPMDRKLKVVDEFHGMNHDNFDYWGIFGTMNREIDDFQWVIACHVNLSGSFCKMYSGIWFPKLRNTLSFHAQNKAIDGIGWTSEADMALFVNESLNKMQADYLLEFERMKHYKAQILTRAMAHDLICVMVDKDVIAGRVMPEFLEVWNKQSHPYTTPRTGWSLFCEISWLLNRLKAKAMIERTMNAHDFFDNALKFNKKALGTVWRQEAFI